MDRGAAIRLARSAQNELNRGRTRNAMRLLDDALVQDPDNALAHVIKSKLCLADNNLAEAERLVDRALEIFPNFAIAMSQKAKVLYNKGELPEANEWLRRTLIANPFDRDGHMMRAIILRKLGNHDEALQEVNQVLDKVPEHRKALLLKAGIAFEAGNMALAEETLDHHLCLQPSPEGNWLKAVLLDQRGEREQAEQYVDLVLRQQPHNMEAHLGKAQFAFARSDLNTAAKYLDIFLGQHSTDPDGLALRAQINGMQPNTSTSSTSSSPQKPISGELLRNFRETRRAVERKDWRTALRLLNEQLRLDPANYKANTMKAQTLYRLCDLEGANKSLDDAMALDKDNPVAYGLRARFAVVDPNPHALDQAVKNLQRLFPETQATVYFTVVRHLKKGEFPQAWDMAAAYCRKQFDYRIAYMMKQMIEHGVADAYKDGKVIIDKPEEYRRLLDSASIAQQVDTEQYDKLRVDKTRITFDPEGLVDAYTVDDEVGAAVGRLDRNASAFRSNHFIRPINHMAAVVGNFNEYFKEEFETQNTQHR